MEEIFLKMGKSINQLHKTIYDLSEITKAQKEIKGDSEINIKEVINEVLGDIHHLVEDSNAVIEKDIQVENIYFNISNLRSIVVNLLTNAIKYRSNERPLKIVITTLLSEKEILLCIEDNGLGISQRNQLKLFSMFKRFHSHVEGTGIGLYIIKRIVENNGGTITVKSKENQGCKFQVSFPL